MSDFNQAFLIANIYRYLMIGAGVAFGYFGYRLFRIGFYERGGELRAHFGEHRLVLKAVAPGVFFALFGVAVITASIARGVSVTESLPPARTEPISTARGGAADSQSSLREPKNLASVPERQLPTRSDDQPLVSREVHNRNPSRERQEPTDPESATLFKEIERQNEMLALKNIAKAVDCKRLTPRQCLSVREWLKDKGVALPEAEVGGQQEPNRLNLLRKDQKTTDSTGKTPQ